MVRVQEAKVRLRDWGSKEVRGKARRAGPDFAAAAHRQQTRRNAQATPEHHTNSSTDNFTYTVRSWNTHFEPHNRYHLAVCQ